MLILETRVLAEKQFVTGYQVNLQEDKKVHVA